MHQGSNEFTTVQKIYAGDLNLVTNNTKHFQRLDSTRLEDWSHGASNRLQPYLWKMNAKALRHKMMAEFLENVRDWPEDAKRSLLEAVERMISKPTKNKKKKLTSDDAFGSWVGPETAEEIIDMIYSARTQNPERDPL